MFKKCVLYVFFFFFLFKFFIFLYAKYSTTITAKFLDLLTGQTRVKTTQISYPIRNPEELIIFTNTRQDDDELDTNRDEYNLLLLRKAYIVAYYLERANHQIAVSNLKQLARKDLELWDFFPVTSETAKLATLKFWTAASYSTYESPYKFDREYANRFQRINNEYDIDYLLHKFNCDPWVIELATNSENAYTRKLSVEIESLDISKNVKMFVNLSKSYRWLSYNTFIQSQNLTKTNGITNTKKLFIPSSELAHLPYSNLWTVNKLNIGNIGTLANFKNSILEASNTFLLFNSKHFEVDYLHNSTLISKINNTNSLRFYNDNFHWFLKHLHFTSASNFLTPTTLSSPLKQNNNITPLLLSSLPLLRIIDRNISTLKNALIYEQRRELMSNDASVITSPTCLLDSTVLEFLYELSNPVTDDSNTFYHYALNNYSRVFAIENLKSTSDTKSKDFTNAIITDIMVIRTILKSQPSISYAEIDLYSKEKIKNLYNLLMLEALTVLTK